MAHLHIYGLLCLLSLFGGAAQAEPAPFRVVTENTPPFQYVADGQLVGQHVDYIKQLLETAKLNAPIEVYPWARSFNLAKREKNVLIFPLVRHSSRDNIFVWLKPLGEIQLSFLTLDAKKTRITLDDIKYARIAVSRDDIAHHLLMDKGFKVGQQLVVTSGEFNAFDLLQKGKVDYVVGDLSIYQSVAKLEGATAKQLLVANDLPSFKAAYYVAINKDSSPNIIKALEQAVANVH